MSPRYHGIAAISDCGTFRYRLERFLELERVDAPLLAGVAVDTAEQLRAHADAPAVAFILLNPSKATAIEDDNTIRRCIGYAKSWGYPRLIVGNLFAYRATLVADLAKVIVAKGNAVGPENDEHLRKIAKEASRVVCGWGGDVDELHGGVDRAFAVKTLLLNAGAEVHVLGYTKSGQPRHPLYMRAALKPEPWR